MRAKTDAGSSPARGSNHERKRKMTKKIYRHQPMESKDHPVEIKSQDVIAETEFHWTVRDSQGGPYTILKKPSYSTCRETPEECIDEIAKMLEKRLTQMRETADRLVEQLMYIRDNREEIIRKANES